MATQLNWTVLASSGLLFFGMVSAGWTIFQTQIGVIQHQTDSLRKDTEKANSLASHELERRESELKARIATLEAAIVGLKSEFVGQFQFQEFHKSVDNYMQLPYVTQKQYDAWKDANDRAIVVMGQRLDRLEHFNASKN